MNTVKEKEVEYLKYIDEHIFNVKRAWKEMWNNEKCRELIMSQYPGMTEKRVKEQFDEQIKEHDKSKLGPYEFDAYRKYFHSVSPEEKENSKEEFELAWKHHYENNLHHRNVWEKMGPDSMPFTYIVEMVCDWQAMGYKFNDTALKWYNKQTDIHIGPKKTVILEQLLHSLCD